MLTNAPLSLVQTDTESLKELPVKSGQLLLVKNEKMGTIDLYFDGSTQRSRISVPHIITKQITLLSASWTGDGPYEQVVSVEGLTQSGYMTPADGMTVQQRAAARNANISILSRDTTTGTLTVVADGDKPTVDIPATVVMIS